MGQKLKLMQTSILLFGLKAQKLSEEETERKKVKNTLEEIERINERKINLGDLDVKLES